MKAVPMPDSLVDLVDPRRKKKCHACGKQYAAGKGFTIHHVWYIKGDRIHSDFPESVKGRREYHRYLERVIRGEDRSRFRLLCTKCHYSVSLYTRYGPSKWRKIANLVRLAHGHNGNDGGRARF